MHCWGIADESFQVCPLPPLWLDPPRLAADPQCARERHAAAPPGRLASHQGEAVPAAHGNGGHRHSGDGALCTGRYPLPMRERRRMTRLWCVLGLITLLGCAIVVPPTVTY